MIFVLYFLHTLVFCNYRGICTKSYFSDIFDVVAIQTSGFVATGLNHFVVQFYRFDFATMFVKKTV